MISIRQRTISGLTWSFIDSFAGQGINFVVGIILARLLSPKEFGLIGMIVIFTAISQSFVDSGFSQALIRKSDCGQKDYSTAFYFNFAVGIFLYLILYILAGPISGFFMEPQLLLLIRVLGLNLIINGIGMVQRTILTKNIDFRLQTKISIISSIISGTIAIGMALHSWGVWSLVWRTMIQSLITVILLWVCSNWRPSFLFNTFSFRELFGFGSKLFVADLIDTTYRNIYYLVIGKYFSAAELGYYSRADEFKNIPSANLNNIIGRVSYPVLSSMQDDSKKLKTSYKKLTMSTMFISFALMLGMAAVAEPLVLVLVGAKWLPCVPYLQLLCFVGMLYPLHALNLNMLNVKGRSDLILKLELVKKPLFVPVIVIGVFYGIKIMIIGIILSSFIALLINSYWSGKMINYPLKEQMFDIAPSFAIACVMSIIVFLIGQWLTFTPILSLCIQLSIGFIILVSIARIVRLAIYKEMEDILISNFMAVFHYRGTQ
jgi:teichuronic acid exporter